MILVVGGSGTLGARVVELLVARGHAPRVLTRAPERAATMVGAEIVSGDLRNPADVTAAVKGCRVVISAVQGFAGPGNPSPEAIDRDANRVVIRAAKAAGVAHFVLLSVQGAAADHPMSLHRAKFAAERSLRDSGIAFTILRPTAFMETWIRIVGSPLAAKGQALVFGPGRTPINFVSARDVAGLTVLAIEDQSLQNETIEIGGPENLTFVTFAERLIHASGKPGHIKHVPLPALRVMSLLARPFAPVFARQASAAVVMNTRDFSFDGSLVDRFPNLPRTTLSELLGARVRS